MRTGVYVEGSVRGETVEEPEGAVADGEEVGEEAGVEGGAGRVSMVREETEFEREDSSRGVVGREDALVACFWAWT